MQEELEELSESKSVYYNPPTSLRLPSKYIRYTLAGINTTNADDINYNSINRYKLTVVDTDPDSDMHTRIMNHFRMCSFDTSYVADNLYHRVLTLYY